GVEILFAQLPECSQGLGQRRLTCIVAERVSDPTLQSIELLYQGAYGRCLLRRVAPLYVELRLDARSDEQGRASDLGGFLGREVHQTRRAHEDVACGVGQQVERIFHATGSLERPRIDGYAEVFGELLPVERAAFARELDRALKQTTIHVMRDQALAK